MKSKLTILIILMLGLLPMSAQMIYDEFDKKDFKTDSYVQFPGAEAIILADEGDLRIQRGGDFYEFVFERHIRIRILEEKGLNQANRSIFYKRRGDYHQEIVNIKAQTVNYVNGKIEKYPIENDDFYLEPIGSEGWSSYKFAFPQVRVGSVLEIKYTLSQRNLFNWEWIFQNDLPTLRSTFTYHPYERMGHTFIVQGNKNGELKKLDDFSVEMRNAPGLDEEPYMPAPGYDRPRIRLQLNSYADFDVGGQPVPVLTSWKKFTKFIYQEKKFGGVDRSFSALENKVNSLISGALDQEEKLKIIYEFVSQNIQWIGLRRLFSERSLNDIFEDGNGSSAEINLVLINMLRTAGIKATPFMVSTQGNGPLIKNYPYLAQFDNLVCLAEIKDKTYVLDATNPLRPFTLPDYKSISTEGWLLDKHSKKEDSWTTYPANYQDKISTFGNLNIDETGKISGEISTSFSGYTALNYRMYIEEKGKEKLEVKYYQVYLPDGEIQQFEVINQKDIYKNLEIKMNLSTPDFTTKSGDFMYIKPLLFMGMKENPFHSEKRKHPIDYVVLKSNQFTAYYTIPEGYEVETLPKSTKIGLPGGTMSFQYLCQQTGNTIQIRTVFKTKQQRFDQEEYENIKLIHDKMIERHGDQIVLKKIDK